MIKALKHNKSNDIHHEDPLTSSVFGQLLHLPAHLFWQILRESCSEKKILPSLCGEISKADFWVSWSADGDDISNNSKVEPDLFIRFDNFDLIIEAKRCDFGGQDQYQEQWINEVNSYLNEYENERKPLYFIALGGCTTFDAESIKVRSGVEIIVVKTTWSSLLREVWRAKENIERQNYHDGSKYQLLRIIDDVVEGFALHKIIHTLWLNTINPMSVNSVSINIFRENGN